MGRSRAKVFDAERPTTKFSDVAGYEGAKAEISEVVDFLRHPERYRRAGAMAPRGVLMVGPPGTGKTLLARAVAGEAEVPFFSVTGSSFVELFVGVGAARVRDLFAEARKRAPAIIFVDEIDAIGQRRGGAGAVANDEREQTLNQLLSEMDGFDVTQGIVVLGATNRPEILDPALLRPGRFDRQVTIPLPNLAERAAILVVHCRDKQLGPDVDLQVVARGTPGFSGADLANLANEAAINAVRGGRDVLTAEDFSAARDRILLGRREGSNVLLPEEKQAVAVHEAGHALVAALSEHADPVEKVTILPAGQALGVTEQLPLVERHLYGEDYLTDSLRVRLGGRRRRAGRVRPGLHRSRQRPGRGYRPGHQDGPRVRAVAQDRPGRLPRGRLGVPRLQRRPGVSSRPFAEATQATIDSEVSRLLREAEEQAASLISGHRPELEQLVKLLVDKETVDGAAVYRLIGKPVPERHTDGQVIAPDRAADAAGEMRPRPRPGRAQATERTGASRAAAAAERAPRGRGGAGGRQRSPRRPGPAGSVGREPGPAASAAAAGRWQHGRGDRARLPAPPAAGGWPGRGATNGRRRRCSARRHAGHRYPRSYRLRDRAGQQDGRAERPVDRQQVVAA